MGGQIGRRKKILIRCMIKYTSKDIIDRAEQLADLQNSDFISDSEKSALLNESWNTLYQKIINANDRTFIKSVSVADGYRLPQDFYQLSSLYVTKDHQQINRVNASQMHGYSITNGTLLLSHEYDDIEVTLEYFPTPKTIFYNSGKKVSRSFVETPKLIVDDDVYVTTTNKIYSYSSEMQIGTATPSGLVCSNGYITRESEVNKFYNLEGSLVRSSSLPFVIKGNTVTYDVIKTDENLSDYVAAIMDEAEEILYFADSSFNIYDRNFNALNESLSGKAFYCRGDGLYFGENGSKQVYRALGDVVEVFPLNLYGFCAFVDSESIVVSFGSNFYKTAYGFNTLFDYPNNIYYTILAYMLAISFKIKQNGDITLLQGKLDEATNQFFDSLQRDVNENYNMKNVYKNSRGRIWL